MFPGYCVELNLSQNGCKNRFRRLVGKLSKLAVQIFPTLFLHPWRALNFQIIFFQFPMGKFKLSHCLSFPLDAGSRLVRVGVSHPAQRGKHALSRRMITCATCFFPPSPSPLSRLALPLRRKQRLPKNRRLISAVAGGRWAKPGRAVRSMPSMALRRRPIRWPARLPSIFSSKAARRSMRRLRPMRRSA